MNTLEENFNTYIESEEGRRHHPYPDQYGKITIGVGRNLTDNPLTDAEIDYLLHDDFDTAQTVARIIFADFDSWSEKRQIAIIGMAMNMGIVRFREFTTFIPLIQQGRWNEAAADLRTTFVYKQLTPRYERVARILEQG